MKTPIFLATICLSSMFGFFAQSEPGATEVTKAKKPMSISYEAVVSCYPELEDSRISYRVDLRLLQEKIDDVFVTLESHLIRRMVQFRETSGALHKVRLENKSLKDAKPVFNAQWETISSGGVSQPWDSPRLKTQNVSQEEVLALIGPNIIERDESTKIDTKPKGVKMTLRRDLTKTLELRLEDTTAARSLSCEDKNEIGTICTCSKKSSSVTLL